MADAEPLAVPIGQQGGGFRRDDGGAWRFVVRRGRRAETLTAAQHLMWVCAHGSTERVAETAWTRQAVFTLAGELGVPDADRAYADLLARQLVVEVQPDESSRVDFASAHQMVPLTYSLGNTPEEPGWYGLGFPPEPWVAVPPLMWWL